MSRLENLYQETILEHNKNPRNYKKIKNFNACSAGTNKLCGDNYSLYIKYGENKVIEDIGFKGEGCAISKASASLMTTLIKGKTKEEALKIKDCFITMLTEEECHKNCSDCLGKLSAFKSVKKFPIRVKCATLIWRALEEALNERRK